MRRSGVRLSSPAPSPVGSASERALTFWAAWAAAAGRAAGADLLRQAAHPTSDPAALRQVEACAADHWDESLHLRAVHSWAASQRLPTLTEGPRIHADCHQAVIGPLVRCLTERPPYEVVRSLASDDLKTTRHRPLLRRLA